MEPRDPTDPSADLIIGMEGSDEIHGASGNDHLYGDFTKAFGVAGDDRLYGGDGDDRLYGGGGNDTFYGDQGNDIILGGWAESPEGTADGTDTVDYSSSTAGITITFDGAVATPALTVRDDTGGTDTLHSIEKIVGTPQIDYLYYSGVVPSNYSLTIDFAGGNDDITNGGNSTTGLDYQIGSNNNGTLFNKDGTGSQIILLNVHSQIIASAHDDTITDLSEHDGMKRIDGGAGDDAITIDGSRAMLNGGDGDDVLTGGGFSDLLVGGSGDDELYGGDGTDLLMIDGSGMEATLDGGDGADLLIVRGSHDVVTVRGGAGNDLIDVAETTTECAMMFEVGDGHDTVVGDGYVGTPSFATFYMEVAAYGVDYVIFNGVNRDDVTIHWDMNIVAEDPDPPFTWSYIAVGDLAVVVNATGESVFFKNVAASFSTNGEPYSPGQPMYYQSFLVPALNFDDGGFTAAESTNVEIVIGDVSAYDVAAADYAAGEAGSVGNDNGTSGDDDLSGGLGDDSLSGGGGNDNFRSSGGTDTIDGGSGDDILNLFGARIGYDISRDAGTGTITFEDLSGLEGVITVQAVEKVYFVTDNEEYLVGELVGFWGTPGVDELLGTDRNNLMIGLADNDVLRGYGGDDMLDGGTGSDTMYGGDDDDTCFVDAAGDIVIEAAGEGFDAVYTSVHYALAAGSEVEWLSTIANYATTAISLVGNEYSQYLIGNAGVNVLVGDGGADTLIGFAGNDTYYLDQAGDVVVEAASEGFDAIYTSASYALGAGVELEWLSTITNYGTTAIDLSGNEFANYVLGNNGANTINGGAGSDILYGYGGADTFQFTTALGAANVDTITDFVSGTDRIALDDAIFTALGAPGALAAGAFVTGTAAADADDRIIYNGATGQLFYDPDGSGAGAAVLFATLQGNPALAASDFVVI